jgi:hypothetical protein
MLASTGVVCNTSIMRTSMRPFFAALAVIVAAYPHAGFADAVSDQKKAYKALGIDPGKKPPLCSLLSTSEVEGFLGKRVQPGDSAGPVSGCAWRAADGSNDGLLVTRDSRDNWYPATKSAQYTKVGGIGEQAYSAFEPGVGYEASALAANGVTSVQLSGKGSAADALKILRVVIKR